MNATTTTMTATAMESTLGRVIVLPARSTVQERRPPVAWDEFTLQPGGWLVVRRAMPELGGCSGMELLERAANDLAGNLRYTRTDDGVFLLGEDQLSEEVEEPLLQSHRRIVRWLESCVHSRKGDPRKRGTADVGEPTAEPPPDAEAIESALAEAAGEWAKREERWVIPAGELAPVELAVRAVPGGVRVEGALAWFDAAAGDSAGESSTAPSLAQRAMSEFLVRAQAVLRAARCEWDDTGPLVVSRATRDDWARQLPQAIAAVAAGCRQLTAEVAALARDELAREYLREMDVREEAV